jgi:hypothetical protein
MMLNGDTWLTKVKEGHCGRFLLYFCRRTDGDIDRLEDVSSWHDKVCGLNFR